MGCLGPILGSGRAIGDNRLSSVVVSALRNGRPPPRQSRCSCARSQVGQLRARTAPAFSSSPIATSASKLAYAVVILTTQVLSPAPIKSPRQIRGQGCLSGVSLAPCSWFDLY